MADSTLRRTRGKATPEKPSKDFPLSVHKGSGYWCKKIKGRVRYFGKVADDPKGTKALELWLAQKDDLLAGREPREKANDTTVADLVNAFLTSKDGFVQTGELHQATWNEYHRVCADLTAVFGKSRSADDLEPSDFEKLRAHFATKAGPTRLGKLVQITRSVFRYGMEARLLKKPVYFGPMFKRPSKKVLRRHRAERGQKLFTRDEVLTLVVATDVTLKAIVLLGINAALGSTDIGRLELRHLDLDGGWLTFPRPKSGIKRRAKLWPETVQAIREALKVRRTPKDTAHRHRVFITQQGHPWADDQDKRRSVAHCFGKLLKTAKIDGAGRGFYCLCHTSRTRMDETRDFVAARVVMGHADPSAIDDAYREEVGDSRLEAVAEHLRQWLYGGSPTGTSQKPTLTIADAPQTSEPAPKADDPRTRPALKLFAG